MGPNKIQNSPKSKSQSLLIIGVFLALFVSGWSETPGTILFFGDSLTAGYGVDPSEAYPALIQEKLTAARLPWRVVNAGLSGETTSGGLRRLDWILRQPIKVFVLALGANDGLRGISPESTQANLQAIINRVRAKAPAATIVLAGMQLPPNLGAEFTRRFAGLYPELARANQLPFIPFLLDGVGGVASLNQTDGIHPNPEGHRIIARTVWATLQPLL